MKQQPLKSILAAMFLMLLPVTVGAQIEPVVRRTQTTTTTNTTTTTTTTTRQNRPVRRRTTPVTPTQQPTDNNSRAAVETITVNGVSFRMVRVEGASTGTFSIGETEVTQALWEAVMGSNPSYYKGSDRPVEQVSWDDCKTFIAKLNSLTKRTFRLPKKAEWEYAAKGGNKSRGYEYSGSNNLDEVGWYYENSGNSRLDDNSCDSDKLIQNGCCTHPVKQKKANELGLYDMSGNVLEWCEDLYSSGDSDRVARGGSWNFRAWFCRVSFSFSGQPSDRGNNLGLRLAL